MNKKLLLTSALVGTVALSGAAFSEAKVSGDIEVTFRSLSKGSNTDQTGGSNLGSEANIGVSGSQSLDNGMTLNGAFKIDVENSNAGGAERAMWAEGDALVIGYGDDLGPGIDTDGSVAPHVGDQNDTLAQATVGFDSSFMDVHAADHLVLGYKALGGFFGVTYAPEFTESITNEDSGAITNDDAPSAYTVGYQGNLGFEGLAVQAAISKSDDVGTATTEDGDETYTKFGVSYKIGQFAIGGDVQDFEKGALTTADADTALGKQARRANVTFAVNENLAVGYSYTESEKSIGSGATYAQRTANVEEEISAITVGYNIAGLGFNFSYAETDNANNVKGTDHETWQIQTKQKF